MTAPLVAALQNLKSAALAQKPDLQKMRATAQDYESTFITQILNTMSEGLEDGEFSSAGDAQWRSLQNEEIAKSIAKSGGFGFTDSIMKSMLALQGA